MWCSEDEDEKPRQIAKDLAIAFLTAVFVAFGEKAGSEFADWGVRILRKKYDPIKEELKKDSSNEPKI